MAWRGRRLLMSMREARAEVRGDPPSWYPNWPGETIVLVAGGPSAKDVNLEAGRGRARFIASNNSYKLCPWADALYACDETWWTEYGAHAEFEGLKVSQDQRAKAKYPVIKKVVAVRGVETLITDQPGLIGWGGNSGFHALNLAVQWGAGKVILVGYDMTLKNGLHWHGEHVGKCSNPNDKNVVRWRRVVDDAAATLTKLQIKAFNCSPLSALTEYPKCSFEAALDA